MRSYACHAVFYCPVADNQLISRAITPSLRNERIRGEAQHLLAFHLKLNFRWCSIELDRVDCIVVMSVNNPMHTPIYHCVQ